MRGNFEVKGEAPFPKLEPTPDEHLMVRRGDFSMLAAPLRPGFNIYQ